MLVLLYESTQAELDVPGAAQVRNAATIYLQ
jgi:hypothetical protein